MAALGRQKRVELCKLEACLVHLESSRPAKETQGDPRKQTKQHARFSDKSKRLHKISTRGIHSIENTSPETSITDAKNVSLIHHTPFPVLA